MDDRMASKQVGETDAIQGKIDRVDYNLFVMKDRDYTIKLMSTHGKLTAESNIQDSARCIEIVKGGRKVCRQITFKHTELF